MKKPAKEVVLISKTGKIVKVKLGVSFTTFFFSFIPDLLRGNFKSALIYFIVVVIGFVLKSAIPDSMFELVTNLLISIGYCLVRNKYLLQHYLNKEYKILEGDKGDVDEFIGYKTLDSVWEK